MTKAYPVWRITAKWNDKAYPNSGTDFRWSFKRKFSEKTIKAKAESWWKRYSQREDPNERPELLSLEVEYLGDFTWYPGWFHHKSLNYYDNETAAFMSFQEYLDERDFREVETGLHEDKNGVKECLMGADDRWRWKFCGCKICKRAGITIIKH